MPTILILRSLAAAILLLGAVLPHAHAAPGAPSDAEFEAMLRVQVFLDEAHFGPGVVDGRTGEFTRKAIAAWNVAHGHQDTDDWSAVEKAAQRSVQALYAAYKIKPGDLAHVTPGLPAKPEGQAAAKYLGYRSLAEFVAERYHTNEATLARLNPKTSLGSLKPGVLLRVPNVEPFAIENLKKSASWKEDPALSKRTILVNVDHKTAAIYNEAGDLTAFFPITPGKPQFVPHGEWKIEVMVATPEFRWDKQMLEQGKRSPESKALRLPPGPNSPVGVLWAGLNRSGIGLHGTATPETIGRSQSAGCIRLANWDIVRLPSLVRPGARVIVK